MSVKIKEAKKEVLDKNVVFIADYFVGELGEDGKVIKRPVLPASVQISKFLGEKAKYSENEMKITQPTSMQVRFDTIESSLHIPYKESLYGQLRSKKEGIPWLPTWEYSCPPSSNDESFVPSPTSNSSKLTNSRKSLKIYKPDDKDFFQNCNPHLLSWFESATPPPSNLYVLFENRKKYEANRAKSQATRKRLQGRPRVLTKHHIEDWLQVKARHPDLYPPTPDWSGYRPPSVATLLQIAYKDRHSKYLHFSQEDVLDISAFEFSPPVELWRGEECLYLEHKPPVLCKEEHVRNLLNNSDESIEYHNRLMMFDFEYPRHNHPLINKPKGHLSYYSTDYTHYLNEAKWDEVRYREWLLDMSKFNPHVDYLPGKTRANIEGRNWYIGCREMYFSKYCKSVMFNYPNLPTYRLSLSDTKTRMRVDEFGDWILETVPDSGINCREFRWLRYAKYLDDFMNNLISWDQLVYARDCIYNYVLDTWLLGQLPGSVLGMDGEGEATKFLNDVKHRILAQEIVDQRIREQEEIRSPHARYLREVKPNWTEAEINKATIELLTQPASTLETIESFVMKKAERKFVSNALGILVPDYLSNEGYFVLSEEDEAVYRKAVGTH